MHELELVRPLFYLSDLGSKALRPSLVRMASRHASGHLMRYRHGAECVK